MPRINLNEYLNQFTNIFTFTEPTTPGIALQKMIDSKYDRIRYTEKHIIPIDKNILDENNSQ